MATGCVQDIPSHLRSRLHGVQSSVVEGILLNLATSRNLGCATQSTLTSEPVLDFCERFCFGRSFSLLARIQSTNRTGRVRGNDHLTSLSATIAYLGLGCLTVKAFKIPLQTWYRLWQIFVRMHGMLSVTRWLSFCLKFPQSNDDVLSKMYWCNSVDFSSSTIRSPEAPC